MSLACAVEEEDTLIRFCCGQNEHADTSRLLSGVSNSTTGRLAGLDALVDRLTRSPPNSWAEQAQAIKRTASKMEGESREYGNMYIKVRRRALAASKAQGPLFDSVLWTGIRLQF